MGVWVIVGVLVMVGVCVGVKVFKGVVSAMVAKASGNVDPVGFATQERLKNQPAVSSREKKPISMDFFFIGDPQPWIDLVYRTHPTQFHLSRPLPGHSNPAVAPTMKFKPSPTRLKLVAVLPVMEALPTCREAPASWLNPLQRCCTCPKKEISLCM